LKTVTSNGLLVTIEVIKISVGSVKTSMKNNAEIEFIIKKLRKDAAICP
jgi:hypothetical protein